MFDLPAFLQKDGREALFIKVHSVFLFCVQFVLAALCLSLHYVYGFVDCETSNKDKSHVNMRCLQTSLYLDEDLGDETVIKHDFL